MLVLRLLLMAALLVPTAAIAADPVSPDPVLTPGEWNNPPTPLAKLCAKGYTKAVRSVSAATATEVFRRYGYDPRTVRRGNYELDHLVSLELDGTNGIRNLWPESYLISANARRKDVLENALHRAVCAGRMPLRQAQQWIARDWQDAYRVVVLKGAATTRTSR